MAVSPDGRDLVFSAGDSAGTRLYVRALDETRATPIVDTEGGVGPFYSPDGEWIGFWADGQLRKVRVDGGAAMAVCDAPKVPYGASWGPDDFIFFGQLEGGILRVSANGGTPEEITALAAGEIGHRHPQLLADGETLLFTIRTQLERHWEDTRIVVQSLKNGGRKVLVENGADPRVAPTGHLVFVRLGALMAAPFDQKRLEVTGAAGVALQSVRQSVNGGYDTFSGQFSFSESGTLVHVPGGVWSDGEFSLVWVDRKGQTEPLSVSPGPWIHPRLSPDGARVAVWNVGIDQSDIWVYDISRGTTSRLTTEESYEENPLWTPDGARIAFMSDRENPRYGIWWMPADGSGAATQLSNQEGAAPASWSPDGQVLAVLLLNAWNDPDIWMLPLDGEPRPFIESPFWEDAPTFSPDGRWLAYASDRTGRDEVYVAPYPGPGPKIQISAHGGISPLWAPNGRELFFKGSRDSEGRTPVWAVDITTEPDFAAGKAKMLFTGVYGRTIFFRSYDISLDGQKFLMVRVLPRSEEPVTQLHVTLNWFEELKRLVPTE